MLKDAKSTRITFDVHSNETGSTYTIDMIRADGKFSIEGRIRFRKAVNCLLYKDNEPIGNKTSYCRPPDQFNTKTGQIKALILAARQAHKDGKIEGNDIPLLIQTMRNYYSSRRNARKREARKRKEALKG